MVDLLRDKAKELENKKEEGFQLTRPVQHGLVALAHPGVGEEVLEVISQGKTGGSGKRPRNKK